MTHPINSQPICDRLGKQLHGLTNCRWPTSWHS